MTEVPRVRTTVFGLHSVRYAGVTLWNELPNKFVLSQIWTSLKASLITGMAAHADVAPADLNFLVASSSSFIFPTIFSYIEFQLTLIIYFMLCCHFFSRVSS